MLPTGMRIYLATTDPRNEVVELLIAAMRESLSALAPRFREAGSPRAADAILFVESAAAKHRGYGGSLAATEELANHADRCFVFDFSDSPVVFLSGLYHALPLSRFDFRLCRAVPPWGPPGPDIEDVFAQTRGIEPRLLFSFRGYRSHPVRSALLAQPFEGVPCSVVETNRFWDYVRDEPDRRAYFREIRDSKFALAPRGLGTSTARLYEIMRLGRPPVILSDEWVPPHGLPWHDFAVRVEERRVADLPVLLGELEPWAAEMGENARLAWERECRPGPVLMRRLAQRLEELLLTVDPAERARLPAAWGTARFAWRHGWHPVQQVVRATRRGTLVHDIRARLGPRRP